MLKRLLGLALLASALLLLLGLFAAQAEAPYMPLSALPLRQASLPPREPCDALTDMGALRESAALAIKPSGTAASRTPQPPEAKAAYHRRCFPAFHYSDRAG